MIKADDPIFVAAIARAKSQGGQVGNQAFLAEMDNASVIDLSENTFEQGDTFTIPATREEVLKVLVKDVYTRLPKSRITGEHPVGYSILVGVENATNGKKCIKRFRVNAPCNSFAEYAKDDANDAYLATGQVIGPKNALAEKIRNLGTQGASLDALLGKTLTVDLLIPGNAAVMTNGTVTGVRKRFLPQFSEVVAAAS
jgi:hypothetical protein